MVGYKIIFEELIDTETFFINISVWTNFFWIVKLIYFWVDILRNTISSGKLNTCNLTSN